MATLPWLIVKRQPSPKLRLYCLPYAGGGAHAYATWQAALAPDIEVCAIQMPGREMRISEPPLKSMDELIASLAKVLMQQDRTPFALFGHSLGALVAFELTRYCRRHRLKMPSHLIVSGADAPQHRGKSRTLHVLPDDDLIEALRNYEGTPPEVLENRELMGLLLPMIRADFEIGEQYVYRPSLPLSLPMAVLIGKDDHHASVDTGGEWAKETKGTCNVHDFEGGHFFIHSQRRTVLDCVRDELIAIDATA